MTGRRIRLVERRKAVGFSQESLAEAVGVDRSTVARWERGETDPQPWQRPRLADALEVTPEEVASLLAGSSDTVVVEDRKEARESAGSMRTSAVDGWPQRAPISEEYASVMRSFRAADRQVGGGHLYAAVVSYLHREVAPELFRASGGDSQEVFTAAAAMTEMTGWMAHDAGRDRVAQQHFARASDLVQFSRDRQLTAHILASTSHLAYHMSRHAEGIGLARRGRDVLAGGARQPELDARLLALEARGLAQRGQARACVRLLERARATLDTAPGAEISPWISRFDEAALAAEAARCLYQLGELDAAGRQAGRVVALRTGERVRSRALGQLTLVTVLLAQGRLEQACTVAKEVLAATRHLGSYLVVQQLLTLRRRLAPQRANAAASELIGRLEEALHERRWLAPTAAGLAVPPERP